ncbi:hypothetical protein SH2C18_48760 [Clostridium sediminicola]|uniref:hydrolase n=1 Tax=Clostridium sediminicola TaxID=3114879 RepID=UPI0031F20AFD
MNNTNQLPIMNLGDNETGCCPRFVPEPWDEKTFVFDNVLFAKASTRSFFYMPLNLGKVMTRSQELIDQAKAVDKDRYMILSQDVSKWKANHYFKVSDNVPGMEMEKLSGTFMTKVFDAEYRDFPKLIQKLKSYIKEQGHEMKDFFVFYTTCPKCAKHYGKNYMVFFGRI